MLKKYFILKIIKISGIVAICLFLIFLNPRGFFKPVRQIFLEIAYPFQKTFYLASEKVGHTFEFLSSISDLKQENESLTARNNQLTYQVTQLINEKKENETLREQLKLAPRKQHNLKSAWVIAQASQGSGSWILIDTGANDGIQIGMPVIVSDGILVGKITAVEKNSSKVRLLTDSLNAVNVIDAETQAKGLLKGRYGLGLIVGMVEQTDVLKVGDNIITSGLGGGMPKGLLIGKIQQVSNTADKLFQQAVIIPKVKYSKLTVVFVIKK